MGLRLIYGRAGTGKSEKCYKEISEKIKQNNKILIITPEQFSFTAEKMLQGAFEKLHLSGRACNRILRVARTAADLAGKEQIEEEEIAEAIGYRSFDKHSWK